MADPPFTIPANGDDNERRYWEAFAGEHFSSYEAFWATEVLPLTYRTSERVDFRLRPQDELTQIGRTSEDVTVAQLHYTLLLNLGRVFDLLQREHFDRYEFVESFVWLTAASDVGDELLQRRKKPGEYEAWDEGAGARARRAWRKSEDDPLRDIRGYRNRLVHGRIVPELHVTERGFGREPTTTLCFPRIERVDDYLDWRLAQYLRPAPVVVNDFQSARSIVSKAWERVVSWAESSWRKHLLSEPPR
jgi:hypothetical protein